MKHDFQNLKHVEVILKTVERCNLNCSYCYFFNGSDMSFKKHPPFIKKEVWEECGRFLGEACKDFPVERVVVDIHGGEPTLQNKSDFDEMCSFFRKSFPENVEVQLKLQTNGTLISPEWIELFVKHDVTIGVSIDGDQKMHDKFRIDHKGRGSYEKVRRGIDLLRMRTNGPSWGVLCVIDPANSAKKLLSHFVDELGVKGMDFLLPDYTHDTFIGENGDAYGAFLCDLFEEWIRRDDPQIKVRIINSTLRSFLGGGHTMMGLSRSTESIAITVASNGELSPHDALRTAAPEAMSCSHIGKTSLKAFLSMPSFTQLRNAISQLPEGCRSCQWQNICGGGFANNRFSKENGFNNRSVYCSGLKIWHQKMADYLKCNKILKDSETHV